MREFIEQFKHWLVHLFTVHCIECEAKKQCRSCDYLRMIIEQERAEKSRLLAQILHEESVATKIEESDHYPIKKYTPWSVRRVQLERAHRKVAKDVRGTEGDNSGINDGNDAE